MNDKEGGAFLHRAPPGNLHDAPGCRSRKFQYSAVLHDGVPPDAHVSVTRSFVRNDTQYRRREADIGVAPGLVCFLKLGECGRGWSDQRE